MRDDHPRKRRNWRGSDTDAVPGHVTLRLWHARRGGQGALPTLGGGCGAWGPLRTLGRARLRASVPSGVASVDVPVALLGYGTVGSAVDRLLREQAADIERATGHRLRVVQALVRDPNKERGDPTRR